MAASDHLSPGQFFHGSPHAFAEGDLVEPRPEFVYSATDPAVAHDWGALKAGSDDRAHVYEVAPTGDMHQMFGAGKLYSSKHPMRVVRRVED